MKLMTSEYTARFSVCKRLKTMQHLNVHNLFLRSKCDMLVCITNTCYKAVGANVT